jgi:pyridoxine 5-phosphate synthase
LIPSVVEAVAVCIDAGAPGITVHPRADRRHITPDDVRAVARALRERPAKSNTTSKGIRARPAGARRGSAAGPVHAGAGGAGEVTSQAGWQPGRHRAAAGRHRTAARPACASACSSTPSPSRFAGRRRSAPTASSCTRSRSRARSSGPDLGGRRSRSTRERRGSRTRLGLGVNAGHDLDLANLLIFRELPFLDEVSIGHAIMSRALFVGLSTVVREYLQVLAGAATVDYDR